LSNVYLTLVAVRQCEARRLASHQRNLTHERQVPTYELAEFVEHSEDRLNQDDTQLHWLPVSAKNEQAFQRLFEGTWRLDHEVMDEVSVPVQRNEPRDP
jgi:hypothetical protein